MHEVAAKLSGMTGGCPPVTWFRALVLRTWPDWTEIAIIKLSRGCMGGRQVQKGETGICVINESEIGCFNVGCVARYIQNVRERLHKIKGG